ncbi:response regulator [Sandaracinobacteroides hominis]|uniref:response regulator n=1 Tax=Sandaracinobacteroides hominis TaxID=2780086 RepID=UPI0018F73352|nr:response regulator [Sandaracinobacteroides hominis]
MRDLLGPQLPYLRRYARALSGSQKSGDAYVRAVLETLVEAPDTLAGTTHPKRDLFRLFHAYWSPHQQAGGLPNAGRHALLLTAVEGFGMEDAGAILGIEQADVAQAVASARAEIAAAIRSRVLIIEDEPVISMHLEQIVEDMGHDVAATAMTRDEAVAEAERVRPDLVLADIQLADGSSGLDAARDILERFDVPVIFITAYPERLLTGERPEPTFLVTKPFEPETVVATIGQALMARYPELAPAA